MSASAAGSPPSLDSHSTQRFVPIVVQRAVCLDNKERNTTACVWRMLGRFLARERVFWELRISLDIRWTLRSSPLTTALWERYDVVDRGLGMGPDTTTGWTLRIGGRAMRVAATISTAVVFLVLGTGVAWAQNNPPIADAGVDQTVFVGESAGLQGTATDPDGDPIVSWAWAIDSAPTGSSAWFTNANVSDPRFNPDLLGDYVLSLVASDGTDWSLPDTVIVTVIENLPPVAIATADVTSGAPPLTVQFDGTGSYDPEGADLVYYWNFDDGSAASFEEAPSHTFQNPGTYVARLTVYDERYQSDLDTITIFVGTAGNNPPIADAGIDRTIFVGASVILLGSATDPDGDPIVAWAWSIDSAPAGSTAYFNNPNVSQPGFQPDLLGDYVLSLVASDGTDWSLPDTVTISVVENLPPVAVAAATPISGSAPLVVQFDGTGSYDPEGADLAYDWSFGDGPFGSTEASPTYTYTSPGTYVVQFIVFDERWQYDIDTIQIVVTAPNAPPVAAPTATPTSGSAPLTVQFAANASDPNGDDLTYAWDFGDDGTSTEENPSHIYTDPGTYVAWLTVSDGLAEVSESITIIVDSTMDLSVEKLEFIFKKADQLQGDVKLWADIAGPIPAPGDTILVIVDDIVIVEAPFSSFVPADQDDEDDAEEYGDIYKLKADDLRVKIDFYYGTIQVHTWKTILSGLDNDNGVQVEVYFGEAGAEEIVTPEQTGSKKLMYIRP